MTPPAPEVTAPAGDWLYTMGSSCGGLGLLVRWWCTSCHGHHGRLWKITETRDQGEKGAAPDFNLGGFGGFWGMVGGMTSTAHTIPPHSVRYCRHIPWPCARPSPQSWWREWTLSRQRAWGRTRLESRGRDRPTAVGALGVNRRAGACNAASRRRHRGECNWKQRQAVCLACACRACAHGLGQAVVPDVVAALRILVVPDVVVARHNVVVAVDSLTNLSRVRTEATQHESATGLSGQLALFHGRGGGLASPQAARVSN